MKEFGINVTTFGSNHISFNMKVQDIWVIVSRNCKVSIIGKPKRTFQTIYSDEFAIFYMYIYKYGVIYAGNLYMMLVMQETMLIKLRKILDC